MTTVRDQERPTGAAALSPAHQSESHLFLQARGISFFESRMVSALPTLTTVSPDLH